MTDKLNIRAAGKFNHDNLYVGEEFIGFYNRDSKEFTLFEDLLEHISHDVSLGRRERLLQERHNGITISIEE